MIIFTVVTFQNSCKLFVVKLNTLHNYYGIFIDNMLLQNSISGLSNSISGRLSKSNLTLFKLRLDMKTTPEAHTAFSTALRQAKCIMTGQEMGFDEECLKLETNFTA